MYNQAFIQKAYLDYYVPGKPNKLNIPIEITHYTENPYIQYHDHQFKHKINSVNIICYNEEYAQRFYVDISYLSP